MDIHRMHGRKNESAHNKFTLEIFRLDCCNLFAEQLNRKHWVHIVTGLVYYSGTVRELIMVN